MKSCHKISAFLLVGIQIVFTQVASADYLSPAIKDQGKRYSTEKPHSEYYGNSQASRMTEASELRIEVEGMLQDGDFLAAIPKAKKAVQLEPGYPIGHILLARALTSKFYQQKGIVDEKLLAECLREWQLIRYHDADLLDQMEAGGQAKRLLRIARELEKDRQLRKEKKEEQEKETARLAHKKVAPTTASTTEVEVANSNESGSGSETNIERTVTGKLAARKKHFGFF